MTGAGLHMDGQGRGAAAEALGKFFPELKIVETTFKTEKDSPHILLPRFEVTDDE